MYGDEGGTEDIEPGGGSGALATGGATGGSGVTGGSATAGGSAPTGGSATTGGSGPSGGSATAGSATAGSATAGSATAGGSGSSGGSAEVGGAGGGPLDGGPPELACTQPLGPLEGTKLWDTSVFACCADYVEGMAPQGSEIDAARLAADPSLVNCCRYIANSFYDLQLDAGATVEYPYAAHDACCHPGVLSLADRDESFCTPWGPPVPPAFATELEVA